MGAARARATVGAKFAVLITISTAVVVALSLALVMQRFGAQDERHAKEAVRETAGRLNAAVNGVFQNAFAVVGATNDNLVALKDEGITDPKVYGALLKQMVQAQPYRFGGWLVWDADDAPRDATALRAGDGALSIYWHQNGMEMLHEAIPREVLASDLLTVPRGEHRPFLSGAACDRCRGWRPDARHLLRQAPRA